MVVAASHVSISAADGVLMVVEPRLGDRLEDNVGAVRRTFDRVRVAVQTPFNLVLEARV